MNCGSRVRTIYTTKSNCSHDRGADLSNMKRWPNNKEHKDPSVSVLDSSLNRILSVKAGGSPHTRSITQLLISLLLKEFLAVLPV
jgi:hypothetical protein